MQLDRSIVTELNNIPWLESCGHKLPNELAKVQEALNESDALSQFASNNWADARTEAQGDLTGYLAKNHYDSYGSYWNNLVKEATQLVEEASLEPLIVAIHTKEWAEEMAKPIMVDLTRAALERSYRIKFRRVPLFFTTVLEIYKLGHLPCGWSGKMSKWPEGKIIAY